MNKPIELTKPLDLPTIKRLEIVRFALIMAQFEKVGDNLYIQTIIETISQYAKTKPININLVRERIKFQEKPKPQELGLLNRVYGIPFRPMCNLMKIAPKTILKSLEKYITEEFEYPMLTNFSEDIIEEIIKFNKAYLKLFKNATYLTKGL